MAIVTPVAPGGRGLPSGVIQDPTSGLLIYRGQIIPAQSYEGVQAIVEAINNRRPATFQDYDRNVGAVTRTYDPVTRSNSIGPANSGTVVAGATTSNPASGPRINPADPPNVGAPPPVRLPPPPPLQQAPSAQGNPPDPTVSQVSGSAGDFPTIASPAPLEVSGSAGDALPLARLQTGPNNNFVFDPDTGELLPADSGQAEEIVIQQERVENERAQADAFQTELDNLRLAQEREDADFTAGNIPNPVPDVDPQAYPFGTPVDDEGNLNPGWSLNEQTGEYVYVGDDYIDPLTQQSAFESRSVNANAMLTNARQQSILAASRKASGTAVGDGDWRVRLRLAPYATYLYKTPGNNTAGILQPLKDTDGVIFPYTPRIDVVYSAEYSGYDLTHNNYRGYFYKGSKVGEVVLTADFTAQDTSEANYLLAVIHFFKACTKMFYGQDAERGSPPPLVYLSGLGEYQFNEHACVISNFNYSLPPDVDYIRARSTMASSAGVTQGGNGLLWQRNLAPSATASYNLSSIWSRLTGANLPKGAINYPPAPPNLGLNSPTYVPTKLQMSLTLLPIQSRQQVSQQFSLKEYANGNLLKGGFW
jgi:hypothetical protein